MIELRCSFGLIENWPQLHEGTYDFPDELIETGVGMFWELVKETY